MRSKVADFQERTAPEVEEKDESWFYGQLVQHMSEVVPKGRDFLIVCPFHPDNNPSCGVDRLTGVFKCFSCGAGGGWNTLAKAVGADLLSIKSGGHIGSGVRSSDLKDDMSRALGRAGIKDGSRRRKKKQKESRPLVEPWPEHMAWRDVDGSRLTELGCVKVTDLMHNVLRVGLPIRTIEGELLGYTCRALDPDDAEPKYTPLAANKTAWRDRELPARKALFLGEKILDDDWGVIVLVEGPYDALYLWSHGIPAVAILGAGNWTDHKAALVKGLGLKAALVLMDNDKAGHHAQDLIVRDLKDSLFCRGLALPKKTKDPGGLGLKGLASVRGKVEALL